MLAHPQERCFQSRGDPFKGLPAADTHWPGIPWGRAVLLPAEIHLLEVEGDCLNMLLDRHFTSLAPLPSLFGRGITSVPSTTLVALPRLQVCLSQNSQEVFI